MYTVLSKIENHLVIVLGGPKRKLFGISLQTYTLCGPALFDLKIVDFQKGRKHFFFSNQSPVALSFNQFKHFWSAAIPTFQDMNEKLTNRSLAEAERS